MLLKGIDRVSLLTESFNALDIHGFHGKGNTELLCLGRGDALGIAC